MDVKKKNVVKRSSTEKSHKFKQLSVLAEIICFLKNYVYSDLE